MRQIIGCVTRALTRAFNPCHRQTKSLDEWLKKTHGGVLWCFLCLCRDAMVRLRVAVEGSGEMAEIIERAAHEIDTLKVRYNENLVAVN